MSLKKPKEVLVLAVLAVMAVLLVGLVSCVGEKEEQEEKHSASDVRATAQRPKVDINKLVGRWLRPDGGYIIEIRSIGANGKLDAAYFNPNPINVSMAEASRRGDAVRVFVELKDVGYPGSSYTLTYDPERDLLAGIYFQAALNQTFDVMFVRTK
jgi:hypothetical protein